MPGFEDIAQSITLTAAQIARLQGAHVEANILEQSFASLVQTGSQDDWGQTMYFYTLMLAIPIPTYANIEQNRDKLEQSILARVKQIVRTEPGNRVTEVVISPVLAHEGQPTEPTPQQAGGAEEVPTFWQPGYFRLFISHTSANKESAHRLKNALAIYNVAAFVAHDDIEPTKEWEAEIERALRTMDAVTAIITPDFYQSKWCDQEVGYAIGRGKLVLPVCKDAVPHGFMGKFQGFQVKGLQPATVAEQLVDILLTHALSSERMVEALVDRMESSGSWDVSKRTISLLEKAPRLNSSQVVKLIRSIETNSQVGGAFGVPQRIRNLIAEIGKRTTG